MDLTPKNAVVLLSGGLDSTTVAAIAQREGYSVHALSFDYGQNHRIELEAASRVAAKLGLASHRTVRVDLRSFGGSSLTSTDAVPKARSLDDIGHGIPSTYVPARNTVFLSLALALAETLPAHDIFIGVNALDYSGYPDCRPQFISAFETMANLGTRIGAEGSGHLHIHTPLMAMSKRDIVEAGRELGIDYSITTTCYDPGPHGEGCGTCDACLLRLKGFAEAGLSDPAPYKNGAR